MRKTTKSSPYIDQEIMHRIYVKLSLSDYENNSKRNGKASVLAPVFWHKITKAVGLDTNSIEIGDNRSIIENNHQEITATKIAKVDYLISISANSNDIELAKKGVNNPIYCHTSESESTDLLSYFEGIKDTELINSSFLKSIMPRPHQSEKELFLDNQIASFFLLGLENTIKKNKGHYVFNKAIKSIEKKQPERFKNRLVKEQDEIISNIIEKRFQKHKTLYGIWNILYTYSAPPNDMFIWIIKECSKYVSIMLRGTKSKRKFIF